MILGMQALVALEALLIFERNGVLDCRTITGGAEHFFETLAALFLPDEVSGVVVIHGSGSFSTVRAMAVIGNALALARGIPIVGVPKAFGDTAVCFAHGLRLIAQGKSHFPLAPVYDRSPNITLPKSL